MVKIIHVPLNQNSYNIYIGSKLLTNLDILSSFFKKKNSVLITNDTIQNIFCSKKNPCVFNVIKHIPYFIIQDGEMYKTLTVVEKILSFLLKKAYGRDLTLIALGGGVVGDITGFVASIYQRGVNFIQIPTTLLAQVDASIGGKTGVNHILGKNMIGTFWQPQGVFVDINFLSSLPKQHLIAGMAEIIKYAIIFEKTFFIWLEQNISNILDLQEEALLHCIKKCCALKSKVVQEDEKEVNGLRIFLNLGHSFAHAIEAYTGYGNWLHGNAVSVGIVIASYVSYFSNFLNKHDLLSIIKILYITGLPIRGPKKMLPQDYISLMSRDKKVLNNTMRFVLPFSIGKVKTVSFVDTNVLLRAIQASQVETYSFVY
ncbi:3-dehydroquinate synthase [Buchnera aphidicola]|uniref:3-dehydroquinate synthase n=1 Tax=Buchnera aphidicola TaxID=9 RepID=UPI00094CDFED|nr:3-dehydroquinate synthase [Buchnera aphidicola]